ncbi:transcriptional regulator [Desulfuromonas versatilis]|uniref:histidine kinase n=1 Tax=Desulfuromonas versatilis TaxID=2802975 RepID=A0ABM8HRN5_9BACT|nr:hybrid sensor histidine kinase/response regulator [Desulfuromonas versatilis]BCR03125.1 transcriptional regulator [Desulfuromonas versatilis]
MGTKDEAFRLRLLETFRGEAKDHVQTLCSGLVELEKAPAEDRKSALEVVFREVHSLKGAARAVEMREIEALCQSVESVFAAMKREQLELTEALCDLLHQSADLLGKLLPASGEAKAWASQVAPMQEQLALVLKNTAPAGTSSFVGEHPSAPFFPAADIEAIPASPAEPRPSQPTTLPQEEVAELVKVPAARLKAILVQTEDFLSEKLASRQRTDQLKGILEQFAAWQKDWDRIRPELSFFRRILDRQASPQQEGAERKKLGRLLEYLQENRAFVNGLENSLKTLAKASEQESRSLGNRVDALAEQVKKSLLVPFSLLLEPLPKLVRDLARAQGKEMELKISGDQVEIDRRILDGIKDPLIHLVRNAVDHGIEPPETRRVKGKPRSGTLALHIARREEGKVEILVSDDGAGIDLEKVKETALREGALSTRNGAAYSEQRILACIFESGVSTSSIITDLSGRGLGLAIVREKVEKLGGSVTVESNPGAGTRFRLLLPTSLAGFRGVVVRVGDQLLVVPAGNVENVLRVTSQRIKTIENMDSVQIGGQAYSLVHLGEVLGLAARTREPATEGRRQVVVLGSAGISIAFQVDEVLGDQEILIKNLGPQLQRVRNVAGATFLGSGKVVPVLNIPDLLRSAVQARPSAPRGAVEDDQRGRERLSVLVVEDSITSRMLLKNILEAAGYQVETAVDGADGFTRAKSESFDLVVSDVDMPRMNGFDLTAKIRSDKKLAETPVVLVTSLESRDDKERGIEVGANAYIVKGDFDQSNLLETIGRLI